MTSTGIYASDMALLAILGGTALLKTKTTLNKKLRRIESELNGETTTEDGFHEPESDCGSLATTLVYFSEHVCRLSKLKRHLLCYQGKYLVLTTSASGLACHPARFPEMPEWDSSPWIQVHSRKNGSGFAFLPLPETNAPVYAKDCPDLGFEGTRRLAASLQAASLAFKITILPFGLPEDKRPRMGLPAWAFLVSAYMLPALLVSTAWEKLLSSNEAKTEMLPWFLAASCLPFATNLAHFPVLQRAGDAIHTAGRSHAEPVLKGMIRMLARRSLVIAIAFGIIFFMHGGTSLKNSAICVWLIFSHTMLSALLFPAYIKNRHVHCIFVWVGYAAMVAGSSLLHQGWLSNLLVMLATVPAIFLALAPMLFSTKRTADDTTRENPMTTIEAWISSLILWGNKMSMFIASKPDAENIAEWMPALIAMTVPMMMITIWNAAVMGPKSDRLWNSLVEAIANAPIRILKLHKKCARLWAAGDLINLGFVSTTSFGIFMLNAQSFGTSSTLASAALATASSIDTIAFIISGRLHRIAGPGWTTAAWTANALIFLALLSIPGTSKDMGTDLINTCARALLPGSMVQLLLIAIGYQVVALKAEYFCFWRRALPRQASKQTDRRP